jgi:hypothetical protein
MVWSGLEPPAPGQRRRVWVHFPAPSAEKAGEKPRITLVLPGWTPIRDVPVS